jgi:hypothetical protein
VPVIPHRHADVGFLERWCIVDAIASHRHHILAVLIRLDQLEFVLWRDARKDLHHFGFVAQFLVAQLIQLLAGEERGVGFCDADLLCNVAGSQRGGSPVIITGRMPALRR